MKRKYKIALITIAIVSLIIYIDPSILRNAIQLKIHSPGAASHNGTSSISLQASNIRNNKAMAGVTIEVDWMGRIRHNEVLKTDKSGHCEIRIPKVDASSKLPLYYRIQARSQFSPSVLFGEVSFDSSDNKSINEKQLYIILDKPIYQPGQKLHFSVYSKLVTENEKLDVSIIDESGEIVFHNQFKTNKFGNINAYFPIDKNSDGGLFTFKVSSPKFSQTQSFEVKRYRPRRYKITFDFDKDYLLINSQTILSAQVSDFSGADIHHKELHWQLRKNEKVLLTSSSPLLNGKTVIKISANADWLAQEKDKCDLQLHTWFNENKTAIEKETIDLQLFRQGVFADVYCAGKLLLNESKNKCELSLIDPAGNSLKEKEVEVLLNNQVLPLHWQVNGRATFYLNDAKPQDELIISHNQKIIRKIPLTPKHFTDYKMLTSKKVYKGEDALEGTLLIADHKVRKLKNIELQILQNGNIIRTQSFKPFKGKIPFHFDFKNEMHGALQLKAKFSMRGSFSQLESKVIFESDVKLHIKVAKSKLQPGEENILFIDLQQASRQTKTAEATVVIGDAAILQRANRSSIKSNALQTIDLLKPAAFTTSTNAYLSEYQDKNFRAKVRRVVNITFLALIFAFVITYIDKQLQFYMLRTLLVLAVVLFILAAMILPALGTARTKARGYSADYSQSDVKTREKSRPSQATIVRRDFPETLLFKAQILIPSSGRTTLPFQVPDNLTEWQ
ncbi:MAG: hypothetical protein HRT88_10710, partial [Lentisphaeraceae bacterium]|nr:hypothetical protein [Lentisphaeraceae bacterium]